MTKENYISFNDFYENLKPVEKDQRSTEEIIEEILEIQKSFEEGGTADGIV